MATPAQATIVEAMLAPIPGAAAAGGRIPDELAVQLEQALHSDDGGGGVWARERIEPNWHRVFELTREGLATKSKHLQLAVWYTEAATRLKDLQGLIEGLRLIAGLIEHYWDNGLLPSSEDGDHTYRFRQIKALNDKIVPLLTQIPLTARLDGGDDYCLLNYEQALKAGFEKDLRDENGKLNAKKQQDRKQIIEGGGITGEMWAAAVKTSDRAYYEDLTAKLDEAWQNLIALVKLMDDQRFFGPVDAPSISDVRQTLERLRGVVAPILKKKREDEHIATPVIPEPKIADPPPATIVPTGLSTSVMHAPKTNGDGEMGLSWNRVTELLAANDVVAAIQESTQLAAQEHGRNRFLRKLGLADVCLNSGRTLAALVILEELEEQIRKFNLVEWESPELIARVWGQLYREYSKSESKKARATELHLSLYRLDPWQGLKWSLD